MLLRTSLPLIVVWLLCTPCWSAEAHRAELPDSLLEADRNQDNKVTRAEFDFVLAEATSDSIARLRPIWDDINRMLGIPRTDVVKYSELSLALRKLMSSIDYDGDGLIFREDLERRAAELGVPVHTTFGLPSRSTRIGLDVSAFANIDLSRTPDYEIQFSEQIADDTELLRRQWKYWSKGTNEIQILD